MLYQEKIFCKNADGEPIVATNLIAVAANDLLAEYALSEPQRRLDELAEKEPKLNALQARLRVSP